MHPIDNVQIASSVFRDEVVAELWQGADLWGEVFFKDGVVYLQTADLSNERPVPLDNLLEAIRDARAKLGYD